MVMNDEVMHLVLVCPLDHEEIALPLDDEIGRTWRELRMMYRLHCKVHHDADRERILAALGPPGPERDSLVEAISRGAANDGSGGRRYRLAMRRIKRAQNEQFKREQEGE